MLGQNSSFTYNSEVSVDSNRELMKELRGGVEKPSTLYENIEKNKGIKYQDICTQYEVVNYGDTINLKNHPIQRLSREILPKEPYGQTHTKLPNHLTQESLKQDQEVCDSQDGYTYPFISPALILLPDPFAEGLCSVSQVTEHNWYSSILSVSATPLIFDHVPLPPTAPVWVPGTLYRVSKTLNKEFEYLPQGAPRDNDFVQSN